MRKIKRNRDDEKWLQQLGQRIHKLIEHRGHKSPYEFWIHAAGDSISRANLNYVIKGQVDVKATTLKKIADALEVEYSELFKFKP